MTTPSPVVPSTSGRGLLLLGIVLPFLGIACYGAQLASRNLTTPWYLPVAGTLGVILLIAALVRRWSVWRLVSLALVLLLCAGQWLLVVRARLPAYMGPLAIGQPFPAFATQRADGTQFTQSDLHGERDNVFVFFRGRW